MLAKIIRLIQELGYRRKYFAINGNWFKHLGKQKVERNTFVRTWRCMRCGKHLHGLEKLLHHAFYEATYGRYGMNSGAL